MCQWPRGGRAEQDWATVVVYVCGRGCGDADSKVRREVALVELDPDATTVATNALTLDRRRP
jgi:hypothetical protein